jgi:DNA-directed RNA polymerase subunit RPC12/RpoP
MIHYSCRQCGRRLVSPEEDEGETFTCPKCGAAFRVPMADGANLPEEKMVPVIRDIAFGEKDFGQRSKRFGQVSIALSLLGLFVFACLGCAYCRPARNSCLADCWLVFGGHL